jgi:hypothetical protein
LGIAPGILVAAFSGEVVPTVSQPLSWRRENKKTNDVIILYNCLGIIPPLLYKKVETFYKVSKQKASKNCSFIKKTLNLLRKSH